MLEGLTEEEYQKVLNSKGTKEAKLLQILPNTLRENRPESFHLGLFRYYYDRDEKGLLRFLDYRVALVNRDISKIQKALIEIYNMARKKGVQEILDVFEQIYSVGDSLFI